MTRFPRRLATVFLLALPLAAQQPAKASRERVLGIGGFFFKSRNPTALERWYRYNLGIATVPTSYDAKPWVQEAGPTAFAPFPDSTRYFGPREQMWMINFRVRNLAAMVKQLAASGIAVKVDTTLYPNGRFARLHDPDGNPIELWEPKPIGKSRP
ncbi:MAG: VOC family protein [Gemmatimonadales bacterium]